MEVVFKSSNILIQPFKSNVPSTETLIPDIY